MSTRTELSTLDQSLRGTKVLSVYLGGAAADPAERLAWRTELSEAVDAWRRALDDAPHDEREAFARAVAALDERLDATPSAERAPGWVAFVTADGVRHAERLPAATPLLVAWGDGPRVAPYVAARAPHRAAAVAVVDARTADVYAYDAGALVPHGALHAQTHVGPVTHMGDAPRQSFHPGTRGETGTDAAEHARLTGRDRMLDDLAERLVALAGADGWILVGGIPEVAAAAVARVPADARDRARHLDGLDVHATEAQIAERAASEIAALWRDANVLAVSELLDRYGAGGTASAGRRGTLEALDEHAVDRLYLTPRFLRDEPLVAEAAVRGALAQDAAVTCVDDAAADRLDAEAGGIAAGLRFRPAREQAPVAAARR